MRHRQRASTPGVNYRLLKEASVKFVGWDWASTSHDVTVLDDQGRVLERWALRHTEQALAEALARLARMASRPRCR